MNEQHGTNATAAQGSLADDDPHDGRMAARPTFAEAAQVWARIGFLSFGGPAGQIALMHREVVETRRWVAEDRFLHALNYCMLLPGPEAQQLAVYIGWLLHGTRGGLVAGILFVLPGLCILLGLSTLYALYHQTGTLSAAFFGLKAAVLAIVVEALLRLARRALTTTTARTIAAVAFASLFFFSVPFPLVILAAGLFGLLRADRRSVVPPAPDTAGPARTWSQTLVLVAVWACLWVAPLGLVVLLWGGGTVFSALHVFFSKMAVVTFGGAYAVLSYVAQQAVETHHWLRPGEMLDGLALAETTPGPLVLVLTFVAYMAAFRMPPAGLDPVLSGLIGGLVATWVTFVPCFALIFLGAPSVERLRGNRMAVAAMAAISAAVVGVILNLAVWFSLHVLFERVQQIRVGPLVVAVPDLAFFNPWAALLALLAGGLLFVIRLGVVGTLTVCAAGGLLLSLL
ncbi:MULTISPECIES: chromate efflux transporter [unclassified Rhizobium]|uniref:chromate efflux transporter n=1 Tax=unclassified Rhizobium TaxID=2613769 RepID=UPI0009EC7DC5|nr:MULTISPECIES: chromate efflux transporter [unclassified Rhizobium]